METLEGTISDLQNTVRVTAGGKGNNPRTTYIALFRLNGQPVQFGCGKPIPFANGDRLKVAGVRHPTEFRALACHDLTTGAVLHMPIWGNVVAAVFLLVFGLFFCGVLAIPLGRYAALVYLLFLALVIYLIVSAVRTASALKRVRED